MNSSSTGDHHAEHNTRHRLFTAENIVAVIRAIPESDGTYRDVARKAEQAEQYGRN